MCIISHIYELEPEVDRNLQEKTVMSTEKGILEQSKVLKVIMTTRKAANGEKAKQELLKTFSAADVDRVIIAELDLGRDPRTPTGFNRSE